VADPRKTAPVARPQPADDAGERLAELNDHLGRFLEHADQLVDDWARFGAQVRASVDGELGRLDQAVDTAIGRAADRAGRELAGTLDAQVAARVDRSLGEGVARLRGELDRLARTAHAIEAPGGAKRPDLGRLTLIAVLIGNALLLIVLLVVLLRGPATAPAPAVIRIDAGVAMTDPVVDRACAALVSGWSEDAAAIVARAGTAACGAAADAVAERLADQWAAPPVDAGVPDAAPPADAAPRPKPTKPKAKKNR
jgi:hypothetical protein